MMTCMRTTLDLDEDVLLAVKEMASAQRTSIGKVLSRLARKGLDQPKSSAKVRNGVPVWPSTPGRLVTNALVQKILNEED